MATKNDMGVNRTALAAGLVFAAWQALWGAVLGISGGGISVYIYAMSMMSASPSYYGFNPLAYVLGVLSAFAMGWLVGFLFAHIWNMLKE